MSEFFSTLFSPANALATGFLVLIIVYWLTVILGLLDMETIDIDVDMDVDVDVDVDVDAGHGGGTALDTEFDANASHMTDHSTEHHTNTDGNPSSDVSYLNHVMRWLNLGRIPLMLWLSFVVLPAWVITVSITSIFGMEAFLWGLLVFVPSFIGSMILAKPLTWPFVKMFDKLEASTSLRTDMVGAVGTVSATIFSDSRGQVSIMKEGHSFVIYAYGLDREEIKKGEQVLVIKKDTLKDTFLVQPYKHD